jgi:hypothetical protein
MRRARRRSRRWRTCSTRRIAPASRQPERGAARLGAQGVALSRPVAALGWGRIERLRRAGGGSGIVGQ